MDDNTSRSSRGLVAALAVTAIGATAAQGQLVSLTGQPAGDRAERPSKDKARGTTERVDRNQPTTNGPDQPTTLTRVATPLEELPDTIALTGVVRDFRERSEPGGHPDFERQPTAGFGLYAYMVADMLDEDGKPVFASTGYRVTRDWKDQAGNVVAAPRDHLSTEFGSLGRIQSSEGGAVTSAESFAQWFRDGTGALSKPLTLTLNRQRGTNIYTFDDKEDADYRARGGFFPINGDLYGNSAGEQRNYHFTFELDMSFIYEEDSDQVFTFTGDDDVWVFIDGHLVIDIGGVHSAVTQSINLDDLDWLENNHQYSLKFFFAERHRTESNFRIDTNLTLRTIELPSVTGLYD